MFFSSKDFDFLQSKETATSLSTAIKDSVLLRFDPLINLPVPVTGSTAPQKSNATGSCGPVSLSGKQFSIEEEQACIDDGATSSHGAVDEEDNLADEQEQDSLLEVFGVARSQQANKTSNSSRDSVSGSVEIGQVKRNNCPISKLVDVTMSLVDVNNDSNLSVVGDTKEFNGTSGHVTAAKINSSTISNTTNLSNINLDDLEFSKSRMSVDGGQQQHHHNGEVKIRNERYEDMERKLKEMEEKEEVLLKRLGEKEKQIAKMGHIVEEYERSIAELMKERAMTKEEHEKRCLELETERNANYQHLSSLETTFSDLHV